MRPSLLLSASQRELASIHDIRVAGCTARRVLMYSSQVMTVAASAAYVQNYYVWANSEPLIVVILRADVSDAEAACILPSVYSSSACPIGTASRRLMCECDRDTFDQLITSWLFNK